jgi:hypothetical protein
MAKASTYAASADTNDVGLSLQYRSANFSMRRSIFWASPGHGGLEKANGEARQRDAARSRFLCTLQRRTDRQRWLVINQCLTASQTDVKQHKTGHDGRVERGRPTSRKASGQ